jgi:sRNA-binding regulator protein Hfq
MHNGMETIKLVKFLVAANKETDKQMFIYKHHIPNTINMNAKMIYFHKRLLALNGENIC